jgi:hypothetical protein
MKFKKFFIDFKNDVRIPDRDKKVLLGFFIAALFPILFIPGWISAEGFFISLFIFSFIPDYCFNILDQTLFLSIYPFDMKSYNSLKRAGVFITMFTPLFITGQIWVYKKDPI